MSVHSFEIRLEDRLRKKAFAHYDCFSMTVDLDCPSKYRQLQERRNTTTGASAASLVTGSQKQSNNNNPPTLLGAQNNTFNSSHKTKQHHSQQEHNNKSLNSNCKLLLINNTNDRTSNSSFNINGQKSTNENFNGHSLDQATGGENLATDQQQEERSLKEQQQQNSSLTDLGDGRENDLVAACPFFRNELGGEEERYICLNKLTDRRQTNSVHELHRPACVRGISTLENPRHLNTNLCPYLRGHTNPVPDYADEGARYYRKYFYEHEHQNWFGTSESYGPLAISIRKEQSSPSTDTTHTSTNTINNNNNSNSKISKYQYRIIIRTPEIEVLRGIVYEDCLPNLTHRTSTKEVLEYLFAKADIPLNKLKLGLPAANPLLLKLDEDKYTKTYKIGVLYCKAGQSTEEEFYSNEHAGPLFEEFLSCIGEKVRLLGWNKYRGGLDVKSDSTGLYSRYAAYEDCEIMFHVSTMLPYSTTERQQLHRKSNIGNDIVTIIFQEEGSLPFSPKMMRSQFQHVFIIVRALSPPQLPDGSYDLNSPRHYAVAVSRAKEIPPFGPPIPESGVFVKSTQFRNFILAKSITAENVAHKSLKKFRELDRRTRFSTFEDLGKYYVTNTTLSDVVNGSNSGPSGAVKMVSSLFGGKKRSQRRYASFRGHSDIQGAIAWDVQVKDFGQSNKIIDCILGISASYLVIVEQQTRNLLYVSPVEAILGWTSNPDWIKIFCHQAECILLQIKDPDVDEICEIVTRLKAVTNGCETRELTLRRKNSQNSLGFDIQPDGIVTRVESGSIAWQTHLSPGSRLVEICKTSTATLSYPQMMEYIKTSAVVTLTVLHPYKDGSFRKGCLGQNCAHQPIMSRHPSTFSSSISNQHFSKPKLRVPNTSLMTLV